MDYGRVYLDFIASRRLREDDVRRPYDTHHILPRRLGGSDDPSNLIRLSSEDHLFAHIILARIHGGHMVRAVYGMLRGKRYAGRRSRREYGWLRRAASEEAKARVREANKRRGHGPRLGIKHTDEAKAKMSATIRARHKPNPAAPNKLAFAERARQPKSAEHRASIGAARKRYYENNEHHAKGTTRPREEVDRIVATKRARVGYVSPAKGRTLSPETRARMSEGRRVGYIKKMHALGLMG